MNGPEDREQKVEMNDPMTEFEQALARSMRRVEVPAETTAKFLALAEQAERQRSRAGGSSRLLKFSNSGRAIPMPRLGVWSRSWMGGAIAAVLAMGIFVGTHVHQQHERRVEAQKQFETAERITDQALARTRAELARQGIELEQ